MSDLTMASYAVIVVTLSNVVLIVFLGGKEINFDEWELYQLEGFICLFDYCINDDLHVNC